MNPELSSFAARLRDSIASGFQNEDFDALAVELFALQFKHNDAYKRFCTVAQNDCRQNLRDARDDAPFAGIGRRFLPCRRAPSRNWNLSCIPPDERTAVFHSSGTTEQNPAAIFTTPNRWRFMKRRSGDGFRIHFGRSGDLLFLTPHPASAPHSSLVHMFETIRQMTGLPNQLSPENFRDGSWTVDFVRPRLNDYKRPAMTEKPLMLLGTAFSFVHLLDYLAENNLQFQLPEGSRVMETGGYKNRSRTMPKAELHALITERLGCRAGKHHLRIRHERIEFAGV